MDLRKKIWLLGQTRALENPSNFLMLIETMIWTWEMFLLIYFCLFGFCFNSPGLCLWIMRMTSCTPWIQWHRRILAGPCYLQNPIWLESTENLLFVLRLRTERGKVTLQHDSAGAVYSFSLSCHVMAAVFH